MLHMSPYSWKSKWNTCAKKSYRVSHTPGLGKSNNMGTDKGYGTGHCRDRVLVVGSAAYGKCSWMRMYKFQSSASLWNSGVHLLIYCEIIRIFQELISDTTMFVGWRTRVFTSTDRLADSGSSNEDLWYANTRLPWLLYSDLEIYIVNSCDF